MNVLLVGNILSKHKGSKGISEKLYGRFKNEIKIKAVSDKKGKFSRFLDILYTSLTHDYKVLVADTYSGQAFIMALTALIAGKLRHKKVVIVLRGGKLLHFYHSNPNIVGFLLKQADEIITPSVFLKRFFEKQGYVVGHLPNFIDAHTFKPLTVPQKSYSMLWVRSFAGIYNPSLAVKTLALVLPKFPMATLTMVGPDDGLLDETMELAKKLNIFDRIKFVGPVENSRLPAYYSSHQVYLNTTSYESFGMAVMEAAACKLATVSTKVGELPFLWTEGEEILFIEKPDEELMAAHVCRLFADDELRNTIAEAAYIKTKVFGWDEIKVRWERVFGMPRKEEVVILQPAKY